MIAVRLRGRGWASFRMKIRVKSRVWLRVWVKVRFENRMTIARGVLSSHSLTVSSFCVCYHGHLCCFVYPGVRCVCVCVCRWCDRVCVCHWSEGLTPNRDVTVMIGSSARGLCRGGDGTYHGIDERRPQPAHQRPTPISTFSNPSL